MKPMNQVLKTTNTCTVLTVMLCVYKTCLYSYKVYIFNLNVTFLITTAQTDLNILDEEPDLEHIHKFLRRRSADWESFARELRVDLNYRKVLRRNMTLTDDDRLERVLDKWKESSQEGVSWKKVLDMLVELELYDMHQKMIEFLKRDDVILKYRQT